jgi:hypothetical protein
MKSTIPVLVCLLAAIGPAQAADKTVTVEGQLMVGRFESAIVGADGAGVSLAAGSAIAGQVLSVCKKGDLCKVTGVIDDTDASRALKSVTKVEQVKK